MTEGEQAAITQAAQTMIETVAAAEPTAKPEGGAAEAARSQRVDLLIVEDDSNDLELALRVLGQLGLSAHVQVARDGAEALRALLPPPDGSATPGERPRLVLLDLKLPRYSGLEVLRRIKENPATRTMPVVVMTSSALDADVTASFDLGANSYVVKPVDFEGFAEAIRQIGRYWLLLNTSAEVVVP